MNLKPLVLIRKLKISQFRIRYSKISLIKIFLKLKLSAWKFKISLAVCVRKSSTPSVTAIFPFGNVEFCTRFQCGNWWFHFSETFWKLHCKFPMDFHFRKLTRKLRISFNLFYGKLPKTTSFRMFSSLKIRWKFWHFFQWMTF